MSETQNKMEMSPHVHPLRTEYMRDKIYDVPPNGKMAKELDHYGEEWVDKQLERRDEIDLSNKKSVFFTFAEAAKKKLIFQGFDHASEQIREELKETGKSTTANLFIPETVIIDYSEYSMVPKFKDNFLAKPYKDGIMLVSDVPPKSNHCIHLEVGTVKEGSKILDGKIVVGIAQQYHFRHFGQIDWAHKNFDKQVIFYVVIPKITKNKAARIVFKNNIHLNKVIKLFRSRKCLNCPPPGDFKYFYDSTAAAQDVLTNLTHGQEKEEAKKDLSNKELLDAGYKNALIEGFNRCNVASALRFLPQNYWARVEEYKNKSLDEIKQEYMKSIFPLEKDLESHYLKFNYEVDSGGVLNTNGDLLDLKKDKKLSVFFHKNLLKLAVLYYHTNKGTTLCNNISINIENSKFKII